MEKEKLIVEIMRILGGATHEEYEKMKDTSLSYFRNNQSMTRFLTTAFAITEKK